MELRNLSNHRVAVVGASGFVGSYLTRFLCAHSTDVVEIVRNVGDKKDLENVVEIGDITCINTYKGVFDEVNTVVYTIARTHQSGEDDPRFDSIYKEINCDAMIRMARAAHSQGVKRFIFLSSIKAIGEDTGGNISLSSESTPNPEGPYGKSKLIAEKELLALGESIGLEVVIIRPPLIYGPGVKGNLLSIIKAARFHIPLPFKSASKNRRSLVSLENLCSLIKECVTNPAAAGNAFFVKDQLDLSTVEIVRLLTKNEGLDPMLFPVPEQFLRFLLFLLGKRSLSQRLFGNLIVDDTFTKKTLGWNPMDSKGYNK